jgi:hypothetical protein
MTQEIRNLFQTKLQEHGYGFEAAVAFKLKQLHENSASRWSMLCGEFPVGYRGESTRIDILLATHGYSEFAVCECKRANPAVNRWCFIRQPHVGASRHDNSMHVDVLTRKSGYIPFLRMNIRGAMNAFAHIGLEIRSDERGDVRGTSRGAIEEAVTQVARGTNGLIQFLNANDSFLPLEQGVALYQVVFTTASLWLSDARLNLTDISTGNVDLSQSDFRQVDWLMYQYPQGPALRADVPVDSRAKTMLEARDDQYYRSVFIVSSAGIEDFITTLQ